MRRMTTISSALGAILLWAAAIQAQTTVTLTALKDNTLYEEPAGSLGNGSGDHFFAGRTNLTGGGIIRRGLLAFDVAAAVPAGAVILDAKLTLFMSQSITGAQPVELHRAQADWAEGTTDALGGEGSGAARVDPEATWIHTVSPLSFWTTPGGDFSPVVTATTGVNAIGPYTWTSTGVVLDVQGWLDNPAANFGWLLLGREDSLSTAKRFDSRTHPTAANRPVLEVTYVIPTLVDLPALRDNTLYEDAFGSLSNGRGAHLFAGRIALLGGELRRRGVILFDVAAGVPAGAVVVGSEVVLHMSKTIAPAVDVSVHRLQQTWGEGTSDAPFQEGGGTASTPNDATWIHSFFPGTPWPAGGNFLPGASAVTSVAGIGSYTWKGPGLAADVQDMLDTPGANMGWLIQGDESVGTTAKRFDSRENPVANFRPRLRVAYYVPAGPCLVVLTGDVNVSGTITSSDIIVLVNHVFKGGPAPLPCTAAGDVNCSGSLTSSDIIGLVNFVFKGGAPPCDVCTIIPAVWSCP